MGSSEQAARPEQPEHYMCWISSNLTSLKLGGQGRVHSRAGSIGAILRTRRLFSLASRGSKLCALLQIENWLK